MDTQRPGGRRGHGWIRSVARAAPAAVAAALAAATLFPAGSVTAQSGASPYASAVMADGPAAYWRLGDTTGTLAASQTGVANGTYQGGPVLGSPGALVGDADPSLRLDGTDDTVRVLSIPALNPTAGLTIEAWIRPAVLPTGKATATIVQKGNQYQLRLLSNGRLSLRLWRAGAAVETISPTSTIAAGRWAHVAGVWDGATVALWVDGSRRAETQRSGPLATSTSALYIGSTSGTANRLSGHVDEVAVFAKALTGNRLVAHRDAALAPSDTTPPAVTLTAPAPGSSTDDSTPAFAGGAGTAPGDASNVTVSLWAGQSATGTPLQTLTAGTTGGAWSVDASPALAPGIYTAQAAQSDAAGNTGRSTPTTFTILAPPPVSPYRAAVLADGPAAYWRLGESSGTEARDDMGGAPAAYRGAPLLGRPGALGGDPDAAVGFDGLNDTLRAASDPRLAPGGGLTLEAWVQPRVLPVGNATLFRRDGQYMLRLGANGSLTFRLWKGGAAVETTTPAGAVAAGGWQHVAATWDGATAAVFVDGASRASVPLAGSVDPATTSLYVGSSLESYDWLDGLLDEVAVYDHALSAERLRAHGHAAGRAGDQLPPAVTLLTPANGSSTTDTTPAIAGGAGNAPGDADIVTARIYAGAAVSGSPVQTLTVTRSGAAWSRDAGPLAPGSYTVLAEQADVAGNVGRTAPHTFTVTVPPTTAYRAAVLADSPRGYWRLGEGAGTIASDEMGQNPGTYRGGPLLGVTGALVDDANRAATFDGLDDTVNVPASATLASTGGVTLEAWLRSPALPLSAATILRKDGQYLLRLRWDGALIFRVWIAATAYELTSPPGAVDPNEWTHVAATYNGSQMTLYARGEAISTRPLTGMLGSTASSLTIGSSSSSYDWLSAMLDEVAVYGTSLPPERVAAHYVAGGGADTRPPTIGLATPGPVSTMDPLTNFGGRAGAANGDSPSVTVRVFAGATVSGAPERTLTTTRRTSGTFSVRVSQPLPDGVYTAEAEQSDAVGNTGRSAATTFSVVGGDPVILAAGDIAGCDTTGDEATAALLDRLPGTVASLGDHVYEDGTEAQFADCYDPTWGRHLARTMPTVGGHEYRTPGAAPYYAYFGSAAGAPDKGYYSVDIGSWHVVSLNTYCAGVPGGCDYGSPQEQWLRQDLAAHPAHCTLALLHEPRYSSGAIHGGSFDVEAFWQALYEAGADLVLSGDDHVYERFAPQDPWGNADPFDGIRQFVVGTGGRSHYAFAATIQPNSEVRDNTAFGVLKLALRSGSYDWEFVPEAGRTFSDRGSAACH